MARGAALRLIDFLMSNNPLPGSSRSKYPVRLHACNCWRVKFSGRVLVSMHDHCGPKTGWWLCVDRAGDGSQECEEVGRMEGEKS